MLTASLRPAVLGVLLIAGSGAAGAAPPARSTQPPRVNPTAAVLQDFVKRVEEYVALHKKLEDTLPKLPAQTTPQDIDTHQRALAKLLQAGRIHAKQGDLFTPAVQRVVRDLLRPIFSGEDGRQVKAEILDKENKPVKLAVNGRYPDEVPISTVPPQVLQALPKLSEDLEYRFILNSLILFDPHSHLIVDFMNRAFS
jgi:hypothetical protein